MTQAEIDQEMRRAAKENPHLTPMEMALYHIHLQSKAKAAKKTRASRKNKR